MTQPPSAASRRTGRPDRAAPRVAPARGAGADIARAVGEHVNGKAPVELRPMRLAVLVLVLVAGAFYVSPLRAFFTQQDRYQREMAALAQARAENQTLRTQIERMGTKDYITRQAREQYQLVPAGLQAFVVKGLPEAAPSAAPRSGAAPAPPGQSLFARLQDLWHTLRE
jgi:cell division protein FtsB